MFKYNIQSFFRNLYKTVKLNKFYSLDLKEIDPMEELNLIIMNFISLSNEGEYQRFNSYDFYSKSSKIKVIVNSILKLQAYRDQYPNDRSFIQHLIEKIIKSFKNLEYPLNRIFEIIDLRYLSEKEIFIEIRNLIVSEWVKRNRDNPEALIHKTNLKEFNYLNYTLEEYQIYLNNCFNLLIRDTKRFISRYPLEYKKNPELDLEILNSLRDSIYNDIKLTTPNDNPSTITSNISKDFNIFKLIDTMEPNSKEKLVLRGWFKNKPNNCIIDVLKYQAYRKSI